MQYNSLLFIGLAIMVYEPIYHNMLYMVSVRVSLNLNLRVSLKGAKKW